MNRERVIIFYILFTFRDLMIIYIRKNLSFSLSLSLRLSFVGHRMPSPLSIHCEPPFVSQRKNWMGWGCWFANCFATFYAWTGWPGNNRMHVCKHRARAYLFISNFRSHKYHLTSYLFRSACCHTLSTHLTSRQQSAIRLTFYVEWFSRVARL